MPKIYRYHHPMFDRQVQLDDSLRQVSGRKVLITVEYANEDFSDFHVSRVINLHKDEFPEGQQTDVCAVCYVPRNDSVAMSRMEEELLNPHFGVYHVHYYDIDSSHIAQLTEEPSLPVPMDPLPATDDTPAPQ